MENMVLGSYFYNFDALMHDYMLREFEPFFVEGAVLEVGSWKGEMTKKFIKRFHHITCVDPESRPPFKSKIDFYKTTIEKVVLPYKYSNVFLIHTLEHVVDPVKALKKIKRHLSPSGRLFVACPNAYAPSRQIAVSMGIIDHCTAVTEDERKYGHFRTYTFDTLEKDIKDAGLKAIHKGGIFFKTLANFQMDSAQDILTPEYMEGCYQLGKKYPDLCSSIFFICE